MNAKGVVTDSRGRPIAGADVLVTGWTGGESLPLTQTAADGTFAMRALSTHCHIGACAAGFGPSPMRQFTTAKGAEVEFTIVLPDAGAALTGVVLGPGGKPVPGAIVRAGSRQQKQQILPDGGHAMGPQCQCALTDEAGRFSFASVEAGDLPLAVRARGLSPWTQTIDLATVRQRDVMVELLEGVVLVGSVRDAAGAPVANVDVRVGDWDDIGHTSARTDSAGAFRAEGLGAGELDLHIDSEKLGKAEAKLRALAGETVRWDAVLSAGAELRGRVEDVEGKPVAKAIVEVNVGWFGFANTDDQGRFALKNCPLGQPMEVTVRRKSTFPEARVPVTPTGSEELVIRLPREAWVFIQGKILDPDGKPLPNVHVSPFMKNGSGSPAAIADPATGEFKYGPYPPGEYWLRFQADGFPQLEISRVLGPDEVWDTGTLRFARGGTLAVTLVDKGGSANPNIALTVLDATDVHVDTIRAKDGVGRSRPLNPGKYLLQIGGEGIACSIVPFEIQSGVETRLDVPVLAGVPIALEIAFPEGAGRPEYFKSGEAIHVTVSSLAGAAVLRATTWPRDGAAKVSCALAPGEYKAVVKSGGLRGETQLSVAAPGPVTAKVTLAP
jgi:protocatechuate 3,4-dioxygenase beta subunit